jgi:phage-related holin
MGDKELLVHFIQRLAHFPVLKISTGILLWLIKLLFGSVFRPAYSAVLILWLADTATGSYHAWANPAVKPESRRIYHGLVKLGLYLFLLLVGHQCSLAELTVFAQTVIEGFIIFTESYSILENLQQICALKGVAIPLLDQIMRTIQGRFSESLTRGTDNPPGPS